MQRKESRANQRTYSNGSMVSPGVCQGRTTSMSSSNFNLESEEDSSEPAKTPTSLARMDVVFENDAISYQPMGNGGGILCYNCFFFVEKTVANIIFFFDKNACF